MWSQRFLWLMWASALLLDTTVNEEARQPNRLPDGGCQCVPMCEPLCAEGPPSQPQAQSANRRPEQGQKPELRRLVRLAIGISDHHRRARQPGHRVMYQAKHRQGT